MKKKILNILCDIYIFIVSIFLILNITGFCYIARVSGESMMNTYKDGNFIIAIKSNNYNNNDVVVAENLDNSKKIIKRIIATPGQTIYIKDGYVYVDDKKLSENYLGSRINENLDPIKLNDNQYFIMGDNRQNSYDSRFYGPIDKTKILAKVIHF